MSFSLVLLHFIADQRKISRLDWLMIGLGMQYVYHQLIADHIHWKSEAGRLSLYVSMALSPLPQILFVFSSPPLTSDLTWPPLLDTILMTYFWSHLEPSTAICTACIMTYKPLFSFPLFPNRTKSSTSGSSANKVQYPRTLIMHESDWAAIPRVLQFETDYRRSMPGSSDLAVRVDIPVDSLTTKKDGQDKRRNEKDKELDCHGDEYECSTIAMGSETSFV